MTAPGAGEMVDDPGCTPTTPCFICRLKATAASAGVPLAVDDRPFRLNLIGVRRSDSERNTFDDRLVAFMALPAGETKPELACLGDDCDPLLVDIAERAAAVNGGGTKAHAGHGVRRVACNSIELEPGKPSSGHRIVQLLPITTDPGLVRTVHEVETLEKKVEASRKLVSDTEAGRDRFAADLEPEFLKQSEAVKAEKGKKGLKHPTPADEALKAVAAQITKLASDLKLKVPLTTKGLEAAVEQRRGTLASDEAALAAAQSPELTPEEAGRFGRDYPRAYKTAHGWAGEQHALFPPGFHQGIYSFGFHLRSSDGTAPALSMGMLMGRRVGTIGGLRAEFGCGQTPLRAQQLALPALNAARDSAKKELKAIQAAVKAEMRKVPRKPEAAASEAKQVLEQRLADAQAAYDTAVESAQQAFDEASREGYSLVQVREGSPRPPGTRVVQLFEIEIEGGARRPLSDDDDIDPLNDKAERWRTGRWVREHFYGEMGLHKERTPAPVMSVLLRLPVPPPLPGQENAVSVQQVVQGKVHAGSLAYELPDGRLAPAAPSDVIEVQAWIGGTNLHRGHVLADVSAGSPKVSCSHESLSSVRNWSTGCQVVPRFVDFNLLILLASLAKRFACLQANACVARCGRIGTGTVDEPEPVVWNQFSTDAWTKGDRAWAAMNLDDEAARIRKSLLKSIASVTAERDAVATAEYKRRKVKPPAKADEAARALEALFASERAVLAARPLEEVADGGADLAALDNRIKALAETNGRLSLLQAQLVALDAWIPITAAGKAGAFAEVEAQLDAANDALDSNPPPAGSPPEHEAFRQRLRAAVEAMRPRLSTLALGIAVRAHHDWARVCDADESKGNACPQRFSYGLFELGGFAKTSGSERAVFESIESLDDAFAVPGAKGDRSPRWSGF